MISTPTPRARRGSIRIDRREDVAVVTDEATGETFYLEPQWLDVLDLADGTRDVDAIRAAADGDVWSALDALADLGLLEERVVPPAGSSVVTRRGLLKATAVAGALAAAVVVSTATPAAAQKQTTEERLKAQDQKQETQDKKKSSEQAGKESKLKSRG